MPRLNFIEAKYSLHKLIGETSVNDESVVTME